MEEKEGMDREKPEELGSGGMDLSSDKAYLAALEQYRWMAYGFVMKRYVGSSLEVREDLLQEMLVTALPRALASYNPAKASFPTHFHQIMWSVGSNYLRMNEDRVRRPAYVQEMARDLGKVDQWFLLVHGYTPRSDAERADFLGCSVEDYQTAVQMCCLRHVSYNVLREKGGSLLSSLPDDRAASPLAELLEQEVSEEIRTELEEALRSLKPRERAIFLAHVIDREKQSRIGQRFGITHSGVSCAKRRALTQLRHYFGLPKGVMEQPRDEVLDPPQYSLKLVQDLLREKKESLGILKKRKKKS